MCDGVHVYENYIHVYVQHGISHFVTDEGIQTLGYNVRSCR